MIPFKLIMLGMPLEDSMGLDVSEKTVYRNQYGIDALIDLSVKLVGKQVSCMLVSAEWNDTNLQRRVAKHFPIDTKLPADYVLSAFNGVRITPSDCIGLLNHRRQMMTDLPRVVLVDWLDFSDMLDYRTLDIYGKRNNVSVICVKQLPYAY